MTIRKVFILGLLASLLAGRLFLPGLGSNIAYAGPVVIKSNAYASSYVISVKKRKRRRGRVRIRLPRGPSYIYYDYPYYYSRGFYPTHIGGYVYEPHIPNYAPRYRGRCSIWQPHCKTIQKKKKQLRSKRRKRRR